MKINRLLTAALITLSTVLTSCVKDTVWDANTGIDESKAAPEEFTYDEEASSATSMTVYWDGTKAVAAGAKSFLIQLTDPTNMDKGDTWNTTTTKVVEVSDDESVDFETATFTGLKEYDCYYVRIRANYPNSVYSPWVYILNEEDQPALMQVGHGAMALVPVVAATGLVYDIEVAWTKCMGATKYIVEWKKAADASWQSAETDGISYTISKLSDNTEYNVKVTSVTADANYTSEVVNVKTNERPPFPMDIATAQQWMDFVNGDFINLANNGADDVVNITADLDFTGIQYTTEVVFKGVVNGNNNKIKNLTTAIPFFKEVTTVKNLTFDATCALNATTDGKYAMVAKVNKGVFENVTNNGNVTVEHAGVPASGDALIAAGIVAEAEAELKGCTNNGNITISSATGLECSLAGGICGYAATKVTNCTNNGNVAQVSSHYIVAAWTTYQGIAKVPQHTGGIVAMTKLGSTIEGCTNNGTVTLNMSAIEKIGQSAGTNRIRIGGIVGATRGNITNCTNTGTVECFARTSDRSAQSKASGKNYSVSPGGITGGMMDYGSAEDIGMKVSGCVNEGAVVVDADVDGNNSTVGGIVSHPGYEDTSNTNSIENCINRGNITVTGAGKFRVGGINGGMANVLGCENYGTIKLATNVKGSAKGSCVAGISGYMGKSMQHKNNKNYGDVVEDTETAHYVAGLIANFNNLAATYGEGCVVKCNVTSKSSPTQTGMVAGYGANTGMHLGSDAEPIKVSGTMNGTPIDASNVGTTAQGTSSVGVMHVVYGE